MSCGMIQTATSVAVMEARAKNYFIYKASAALNASQEGVPVFTEKIPKIVVKNGKKACAVNASVWTLK
ncbi:hypothetical protein NXF25_013613 [Crotalus adamanteus]|uniref:Uncharacterized protein n=1 Tax=Crotalus adamanteus TaxID=8729 RepID=A0AAW1B9M4_CROAD